MNRKIVGISTYTSDKKNMLNSAYVNAFTRNELTPIMLPTLKFGNNEFMEKGEMDLLMERAEELVSVIDVLVLSGGGDINPVSFGEENYDAHYTNIYRDKMEVSLLIAAIKAKKPIMGICRGFQLIGQHFNIPNFQQSIRKSGELHASGDRSITSRSEPAHHVYLDGSLKKYMIEKNVVSELVNGSVEAAVNSWHHQGLSFNEKMEEVSEVEYQKYKSKLRKENKISILASTPCIIEAYRHTIHPIFATQWHPEEYGNNGLVLQYFIDTFVNKKIEEKKDEVKEVEQQASI